MGYSNWSNEQYSCYASSTNLRSLSRTEVFKSNAIHESLDPKKITIRESRDSDFNPRSTPVIFGLDETGSMGYVAEAIAKEGLPKLMSRIYLEKPISDPHLMFIGFGDVRSDTSPLQMSQFETDIRIVEQLRDLYLEGRGGGNDSESVNLAWYAAAYLTDTDAAKRGDRGFLFTISDEGIPPPLKRTNLESVFGSNRAGDMTLPETNEELLKEVRTQYNTFHIIAEDGNYARTSYAGRSGELQKAWTTLMGPNVLFMKDHQDLTDIVIAVFEIVGGKNIMDVIEGSEKSDVLRHAFRNAIQEN